MKKIAVVGSLNIDHVLKVKELPSRGETIISESYQLKCGGKGANQAASIGRLGMEVVMIGKIGNDEAGNMQIDSLNTSQVNTNGIIIEKNQKTGAAFITVNEASDNNIVLFSGANGNLNNDDIDLKKKYILDSDAVVLQMEIPVETTGRVINFAYENKKKIILSLAPARELDRRILGKVDFLMVNEVEIQFLCGTKFNINNINDSIVSLRRYFKNNIIITLGEMGSVLIDSNDTLYRCPAYRVKAIDSTAAGDAFTGGFIFGLVESLSLRKCLEIGNAAGALTVTKMGAQPSLPFRDELIKFLAGNNSKIEFDQ